MTDPAPTAASPSAPPAAQPGASAAKPWLSERIKLILAGALALAAALAWWQVGRGWGFACACGSAFFLLWVYTPARFTDPGCRTDVRLGALLLVAAIFLLPFSAIIKGGPTLMNQVGLVGAALLLWGIPWQAIQGWRQGRPGYPWKLAIVLGAMAPVMFMDVRYRENLGDHFSGIRYSIPVGVLLAASLWTLLWWPVSRLPRPQRD